MKNYKVTSDKSDLVLETSAACALDAACAYAGKARLRKPGSLHVIVEHTNPITRGVSFNTSYFVANYVTDRDTGAINFGWIE